MNLDIGAKRPIDGEQVFLVGRCFSKTVQPPFVLLYDAVKAKRAIRTIRKIDPTKIVTALGDDKFVKVEAPHWGTVWFRISKIRGVQELPENSLDTCKVGFGSFVLFEHDPEPPDQHAGFVMLGVEAEHAARLLNQSAGK